MVCRGKIVLRGTRVAACTIQGARSCGTLSVMCCAHSVKSIPCALPNQIARFRTAGCRRGLACVCTASQLRVPPLRAGLHCHMAAPIPVAEWSPPNDDEPTVFILRGLPGTGKSHLSARIEAARGSTVHCSADLFFTTHDGTYQFDIRQLVSAPHPALLGSRRQCARSPLAAHL